MSLSGQPLEKVLTVLPVRLKTGWLTSKEYTLVFTEQQLIFALLSAALVKRAVADATQAAKGEGAGWWKTLKAQMGARAQFSLRYLEMTPTDMLTENPANFAVANQQIVKIRYQPGRIRTDANDTDQFEPGRIRIETSGTKLKLRLTGEEEKELGGVLQSLFGQRLKM